MTDKRKENRAGSLLVLLNKEQREQIDKAAKEEGRSASGFLRYHGLYRASQLTRSEVVVKAVSMPNLNLTPTHGEHATLNHAQREAPP